MIVLVKKPLRWSPDGIVVRAALAEDTIEMPDAIARGLIESGHVVLVPENKAMRAGARKLRGGRRGAP